jgi:leucyl aminopeptidase
VTLLVPDAAGFDPKFAGRALAEGAILADFDSDTYKSDRVDRALEKTTIISADGDATMLIRAGVLEGDMIAHAQNFARALVLEPGNKLTPTMLGERAAAMATASGLKSEVYGAAKLHELKMGAFWSVSQGSAEPPALIVITYEPENTKPDAPVLGLVGKGITFDTGGISIKPADGMEKMKYDMAGAAAMLGAMQAIAALKPSVKVIGVVCSAENMPSGTAQKPGDIQTAMSGKTIEVMNTDAEGRLVLADGITYAKQLGATHLIDAATLTGAVGIALGQINGGAFSNDDDTYAKFVNALEVSGERFWRLPVEDDYRDQIKSTIADIMNTGKTRHGGAINGAMFLKEFAEDTPWIHLDIAAVAWSDEQKPWLAAGPTGVAVRSILEWVRSYSE